MYDRITTRLLFEQFKNLRLKPFKEKNTGPNVAYGHEKISAAGQKLSEQKALGMGRWFANAAESLTHTVMKKVVGLET